MPRFGGATPRRPQTCEDQISMVEETVQQPIIDWYATHARDLPWRRPDASAWAVMVSEFMLQQTPVSRVLPVYENWMHDWPEPANLAAASPADAVRAWGRLGYPRRALRLHAAATAIAGRHGGRVPAEYDDLRALPGVGAYTAAAISVFAYRRRRAVLDTNVRRVLVRVMQGREFPANTVNSAEQRLAESLLPDDPARAAVWSVAAMELGALVCSAASPRCDRCPVRGQCAWRAAGFPAYDGPRRPTQTYAGTDRQCRGRLLGVLREAAEPVPRERLDEVWDDAEQRQRALDSLLADGLAERFDESRYRLPETH
ncbi:MAG: A/G-specific adenine glycosylase [Propionibacteriales bacterium]|nr:A/G-specific adenine glycosylase [Propionibacteriales bacterium]